MKAGGVVVRPAAPGDHDAVVAIAREAVADGTTYAFAPDTPDDALRGYFLPQTEAAETFVAVVDGRVGGMYVLRPNAVGRGSHVANASFVVARRCAGRGVGRRLGEHSLARARARGFRAMQFNFVVSTNTPALALWKRLGFRVVGELPEAFQHPTLGLVSAYVMHRFLE